MIHLNDYDNITDASARIGHFILQRNALTRR